MSEKSSYEAPSVSVIILNHNGMRLRDTIASSVQSLRSQSGNVEIILVDDSSTDESLIFLHEIAQLFDCKVVSTLGGRKGLSAARNVGICASTGSLIAFLDNDAVPCEGWLDAIRQAMATQLQAGACASKVLFMDRPEIINSMGCVLNKQFQGTNIGLHQMDEFFSAPAEIMYPTGCGMVVRKAAFDEIGLFDEGFLNWAPDDADIGLRLRRAGWEIILAEDAQVKHIHNSSYVRYWDMRNRIRMALKYLNWTEFPKFLLRDLRYNVPFKTLPDYLRGWFSCFLHFDGFREILNYRRQSRHQGRYWPQFERFFSSGLRLYVVPDNRPSKSNAVFFDNISVGHNERDLLYHGWFSVEEYLGYKMRFALGDASLRGHLPQSVNGLSIGLVSPRNASRQRVVIAIRRIGDARFVFLEELVIASVPRWYQVKIDFGPGDYELVFKSEVPVYDCDFFPRCCGFGWFGLRLGIE